MERMVTFIVTKDCQLRCKYCYQVDKSSHSVMSFDTAKKAVDCILKESKSWECDSLVFDFTGGEPLLQIKLINRVVDYIFALAEKTQHPLRKNIIVRITTNGILYGTKQVQDFINKYKEYLRISISIDGDKVHNDLNRIYKNGRGSYDDILSNVKLWIEQFSDALTRITVSSANIQYVYECIKHLIELGIKRIDVSTIVENTWETGDDIIFENQMIQVADYIIEHSLYNSIYVSAFETGIGHPISPFERLYPCGGMTLSVDSLGHFYNCMRFANYSLRNKRERIIGNIYVGIDKNKTRPIDSIEYQTIASEKCLKCEVASGCKWCPAENLDSSLTNTIFQRATAICLIHKAKVRAKNYYHRKLSNITNYEY